MDYDAEMIVRPNVEETDDVTRTRILRLLDEKLAKLEMLTARSEPRKKHG